MAPVKRSTTVAQRETRSTRSTTVAKKNAVAAEKKAVSPKAKKPTTAKKPAISTRRGRRADQDAVEENDEVVSEQPAAVEAKTTRTRATKSTTTRTVAPKAASTTTDASAAPRRRIKVTPLDAPKETKPKDDTKTTRGKSRGTDATTQSMSKRKAPDEVESDMEEVVADFPQTKSTRKTVSSKEPAPKKRATSTAAKTRTRPKKTDTEPEPEQSIEEDVLAPPGRLTRARAGSTATQQSDVLEGTIQPRMAKATTGVRKKVTFQDLPEDDKENLPMASSKTKKPTVQRTVSKTTAKAGGIRAKPVRSTATSSTVRAKKSSQSTNPTSRLSNAKDQEKNMPTVLTPKKISQVAKGKLQADEHDDFSDGEDELNGGKTPVRDLSMSPRRPPTSAMAKAMSPVKKLSFEQSLLSASTSQSTANPEAHIFSQSTILASPARRLPASPFKDGLKDSPRRGMGESTRILFPAHNDSLREGSASLTLAGANLNSASQNMTTLLQSPKRNGTLDADFFSQSAMKKSTSKSPFKSSLLASPAKRLFSPEKQALKSPLLKISDLDMDIDDNATEDTSLSPLHEVTATSHFQASESPIRVHRMDLEASSLDFDDSILPVGSPFKVNKGMIKQAVLMDTSVAGVDRAIDLSQAISTEAEDDINGRGSNDVDEEQGVDPSQLQKSPETNADQIEDVPGSTHLTPATEKPMPTPSAADQCQGIEATQIQSKDLIRMDLLEASGKLRARTVSPRDVQESSDDELAADVTPVKLFHKHREGIASQNLLSRQSFGVPSSAAGKGYGFTPLAAQMSGWLATSPKKTPGPRASGLRREGSFEFSPVAGQHIDGEVIISRDATPVRKLSKRDSLYGTASNGKRKSLGLRKSLMQRQSLGGVLNEVVSDSGVATENPQFEELMAVQVMEDQAGSVADEMNGFLPTNDNAAFEEIMSLDACVEEGSGSAEDDTIVLHEAESEDSTLPEEPVEFTTDLINFTHASDTAMVDFQKLAEEAEDLANEDSTAEHFDVAIETDEDSSTHEGQEESVTKGSDDAYGDENAQPTEQSAGLIGLPSDNRAVVEQFPLPENIPSPVLQPTSMDTVSPSVLVIDSAYPSSDSPEADYEPAGNGPESSAIITPIRPNIQLGKSRMVNTVVSKVPLKPEGHMSPIKMSRKRARSFGNSGESPVKRLSMGGLKQISNLSAAEPQPTPNRQTRTSAAPSPGGTSTPASRYGRSSLGGQSALMTPGQTSFMVEDFGDSTLDGIELPDDITQVAMDSEELDLTTPGPSEKTFGLASMMATPVAVAQTTPATQKRSIRRATAPVSAVKTPTTSKKTPQRNSLDTNTGRTPLKPVGKGVLDGAVVFVDVHTSEGADASGIFVELLNQMGAKCVKEWRWNPRTSLAVTADAQNIETNVGITHVVYKDGGKRTLEKVRDAKGEVCCVGVAWVLDCERESKWLDESTYAVDTALMPRGGSRRRKSMEPRALLLNGNGAVSAGKPRRSVSAEMSEMMKRELVNTPVRGREISHGSHTEPDEEDEEDVPAATPTGFIAYDPRTAMTPGTPYLANQSKHLVQMSAPPKQTGKRLFEDDNDENDRNDENSLDPGARGLEAGKSVDDAKKFKMKNLDMKSRRRTLGFKPIIGSPLSRTDRS